MNEWLGAASARLASSLGEDPAEYDFTDADVERLLDLARIAAHDSGERVSAPLLCYLVGLAAGRHPEHDLATLVEGALERR
jgi:Domain of unknown function (DUF6457)